MTKNELDGLYFRWMCQLVCNNRISRRSSYQKLLEHLHQSEFIPIMPMDDNREIDGIDLRYRFGYENQLESPMIASLLDDRPCSMLEMMVALAIRCEETLMYDLDLGDRTGEWFWQMVDNLGLGDMDDAHFSPQRVDGIIERFIDRRYDPDGRGGLFYIPNYHRDMRNAEIWYQMCWYFDEIIRRGG